MRMFLTKKRRVLLEMHVRSIFLKTSKGITCIDTVSILYYFLSTLFCIPVSILLIRFLTRSLVILKSRQVY